MRVISPRHHVRDCGASVLLKGGGIMVGTTKYSIFGGGPPNFGNYLILSVSVKAVQTCCRFRSPLFKACEGQEEKQNM